MDRTSQGPTRRSVLAAVGAAGLTGLAGCSGGDESSTAAPSTGSPEPTATTTPEQTANGAGPSLPPGTSEGGIDDPSALVSATQSALRADGYAIESVVPLGGESAATVTVRSSLDQRRYLYVFETPSETTRRYVADGTSHVRAASGGETTYATSSVDDFTALHEGGDQVAMLGDSEGLGGILRTGSYAPDGTVTRDGRRLREFALESAALGGGATAVSGDGGALVSGDGVVFEASLPYTASGSDSAVDWSFTVDALGGVSVSEPGWVRSN